jgi:hypothetical protein
MDYFIYNIQGVMHAIAIYPPASEHRSCTLSTLPEAAQTALMHGNSMACDDNKLTKSSRSDMHLLTTTATKLLH